MKSVGLISKIIHFYGKKGYTQMNSGFINKIVFCVFCDIKKLDAIYTVPCLASFQNVQTFLDIWFVSFFIPSCDFVMDNSTLNILLPHDGVFKPDIPKWVSLINYRSTYNFMWLFWQPANFSLSTSPPNEEIKKTKTF